MNSITELHNEAMQLAEEAQLARLEGKQSASLEKYREAFKIEREAALTLENELDSEPDRSILFRSAASLALACDQLNDAMKLIELALDGHPPAEVRDELLELQRQINDSSVRHELHADEFVDRQSRDR